MQSVQYTSRGLSKLCPRCQDQMAKQAKVNMMYRGACDAVMDDAMLLYDMMRKKLR